MNTLFRAVLTAALCVLPGVSLVASDWPTWRCDPSRGGYTSEDLADELHLQWTLELPKPALAWPNEPRTNFDASYEPVVMGKRLFVGSPNEGSVTAYDTETGKTQWRFFANGPVRFAPVASSRGVFFGSDDGRLYCLDARTGALKWSFRAAPESRPDLHHLGNNRLISFWPIRGGPVISNGKLFFASGIWPTLGIFVYALDPATGKVLWLNDSLNFISNVRIDHNRILDTALAPQGYLICQSGKLLVPNGRSNPAGLDPETGKLLYYVQGYRRGDSRATASANYIFVGAGGLLDINTGREMGGDRFNPGNVKKSGTPFKHWYGESPIFDYKLQKGCDAWSVLSDGKAYGGNAGSFYAHDLVNAKTATYEVKSNDLTMAPNKWEAQELWNLKTPYAAKNAASRILIGAGARLYGHVDDTLISVKLPGKEQRAEIAWKKKLPAAPSSMLAADGKLFVATEGGRVLCFGPRNVQPQISKRGDAAIAQDDDSWPQTAQEILKVSKRSNGYCLVLGLEKGRLVEELLKQSALKVIAVDDDRAKVDSLRDRLIAGRLYGERAELFTANPFKFAYPPYIADLVVSEKYGALQFPGEMKAKDLFMPLRPYGGTFCVKTDEDEANVLQRWIGTAGLENAKVAIRNGYFLLEREGPLNESGWWTHESADAARSYLSHDKLVKPPFGILWYGDGPDHGFQTLRLYGKSVKPQVIDGRLFAFQIEARKLRALDVYTGRLLWEKKMESEFMRCASMHDGVYVAQGNTCAVLDPATGAELRRSEFYADDRKAALFVSDIRVGDDVIVIGADYSKVRDLEKGLWDGKILAGMDRKTGKQLWTISAKDRFNLHALAMGEGLAFCADSPAPAQALEMKRRGNPPETLDTTLMALELRTGQVKWRIGIANPFETFGGETERDWLLPQMVYDDWLAYSAECGILLAGKLDNVGAFEPQTGKQIWGRKIKCPQPIVLKGARFYHQQGECFDIRTGEKTGVGWKRTVWGGCNYGIANEYMFFVRDITAAGFDMESGKKFNLLSVRTGCCASMIPADGVLTTPNFSVGCSCNYPVQTAFSLVHQPEVEPWASATPVEEPLKQVKKP